MLQASRPWGISAALAGLWVAVIVYASLFPFGPWRWPPGADFSDVLWLPWPRGTGSFDLWSNLAGYAPLGLWAGIARGRTLPPWRAAWPVWLGAALLSYVMECSQHFVLLRVPSGLDWVLNAVGAGLGLVLAWAARTAGWVQAWSAARRRWLLRGGSGAPLLLLLWPLGLLFPTPLPLGLGQIGARLRELALDSLVDVAGVQALVVWLEQPSASVSITPSYVGMVSALGLLAPCLVAFAVSAPGLRRLFAVLMLLLTAALLSTLSAILSFGPAHALAWAKPGCAGGLMAGAVLAVAMAWAGPRLAAALGLMVISGLLAMVWLAAPDPYFAVNLAQWEQGRFIRLHGLAEWVGWLWPYAALAWLLRRLAQSP